MTAALSMPTKMRPGAPVLRGPSEATAIPFREHVRDAIALRCAGGERVCPAAHEIEADVVVALHAELVGRVAAVSGHRAPAYMRNALRGEEHALTVCDLARIAVEAPLALVPALEILSRAIGYELTPLSGIALPVGEALAQHAEASARTTATVARADADGEITPEELEAVDAALAQQERRSSALRASVAAKLRRAR